MIAQIISNRFDNILKPYDISLSKLVEQPTNVSKDKCVLMKFVTVLPTSNGKRAAENYDKVLALELDFDSNVSIKEFEQKYKQFQFYLYTTSSHSKNNNKFRVIVPLKFEVSFRVYSDKIMKECLTIFWEGIDSSCFANFHNMPNKPQNGEEYYYKINTGELWSFELLQVNYKRLERKKKSMELLRKMQKEDSNKRNSTNIMSEQGRINYKNKVSVELFRELNNIPRFKTGSRYNKLCSITGKFVNAKYPDESFIYEDQEIIETIRSHTNDKSVEKMVHSFLTRR